MKDSDTRQGRASRRDLLKYTGAGAAGVALAGCKTRAGAGATGGGNVQTASGGDSVDNLSGQKIKLGLLAPEPKSFPIGTSMKDSALLAKKDINDSGGIAGAEVELKIGDTKASPGTGREEFIRLVQEEGVYATFGTFLTQVTLNIFAPMSSTKTIHVTTAAAGPKPAKLVHTRYPEFKYHFRVGPINSFDLAKAEMEFLKLWAKPLGWKKVAPLIENIGPFDPFAELLGKNIEQVVEPVATSKGQKVTRTSSGTTNWTPVWDEVEKADADLALVAQALTGTAAVKQWYNEKRQFQFGGIHVPSQVYEFWKEVSGACRYVFTMNAVTPQTSNTKRTRPFMKRYRQRFDTYPVYSGPITYDGFRVFRKAVENYFRKNPKKKKLPSSEKLIPHLEDVRFTKGIIIPEFQFTPKKAKYAHDPQWTSMKQSGVPVWQQWQMDPKVKEDYGTMHSFAPKQNKTAKYSYPWWIDYPKDHPANTDSGPGKQPPKNP